MHAHTPYPYEHFRETASKKFHSTGFEIDEVTTCVSLSMRMSPLTEEYPAFNETPMCQTWGLNSGGLKHKPWKLRRKP
jgi:hypothetical protein